MISKFVREQKRYVHEELCSILECTEKEVVGFIHKLKEYGVLKVVKASVVQKDLSDLQEEDVEVADCVISANKLFYIFTFVGVIVIAGRVLKCYPKYILHSDKPTIELRQIMKVMRKYNTKKQIIRMFNDNSESQGFNLLADILFLLQDYYENGVYCNTEDVIEINGLGEIMWEKTINETFTLLVNSRPYYMELFTKRRMKDDLDYYKRLHECILTKVSKDLADILELFDILVVDLSDEELEDFGEKEYILYRIEKELSMQFNSRKQLVLKALHTYINHSAALFDIDFLSVFGTNTFNLVWEGVCAEIMDNQLDKELGTLELPVPLKSKYDGNMKLIDLIEKPLWTATGRCANNTLIPDLISIKNSDCGNKFVIFDAKYYSPRLEMDLVPRGQPGIGSIIKQYLYQLAYQEFIHDHNFSSVDNCFLLPTEEDEVIDKGETSLLILESLGLQNIKVRFLPAERVYFCYLSGQKLDIDTLKL